MTMPTQALLMVCKIQFLIQNGFAKYIIAVHTRATVISMLKRKAENNVLNTANYGIDEAVVLCEANLHVEGKVRYCPAYMASLIGD